MYKKSKKKLGGSPEFLTIATALTIIIYKIKPNFLVSQSWFMRLTSKDALLYQLSLFFVEAVAVATEHLKMANIEQK